MDKKRRSGISVMLHLIGLLKPLFHVMIIAITLGVIGYLCAIFLTIFAGYGIIHGIYVKLGAEEMAGNSDVFAGLELSKLYISIMVMAVTRGLLHYGEQYCNHFIAFKLLAIVRHKIFEKLRTLCPAKLEGRDRGNLISVITSDIELLEVFYAHTISPIVIGTICSLLMVAFIGNHSIISGIVAGVAYITVGVLIPVILGGQGGEDGLVYRNQFGNLNSYVLESLRGIDETIQYDDGDNRYYGLSSKSYALEEKRKSLTKLEGKQRSITNLAVLGFSIAMLFFSIYQIEKGSMGFADGLIVTVAMMSSFGPVIALSNLSNNLNQTLASGERVLALLEEEPILYEVEDGENIEFTGQEAKNVDFAYGEKTILENFSMSIEKGEVVGIHGPIGCGKSTLLKLLMRFWEVDDGTIEISGKNIKKVNTESLRDAQSYVTQDTYIFKDTIARNIEVGKLGASREEIMEAAKKASIHDFIMDLPDGYDTQAGELGDSLSGGERQRIGIARAFLHNSPFIMLDEPTSNLDSLNEGIILKSLKENSEEKTVLLASHRLSTLSNMDRILEIKGK